MSTVPPWLVRGAMAPSRFLLKAFAEPSAIR